MIYLGYLEDFSIIVRQYELKMVPVMLPIKKFGKYNFPTSMPYVLLSQ